MKKVNAKQAASMLGVCVQRIHAKIKQGHFPGAHTCECGISILIPEGDIVKQPGKKRISLNAKKSTSSNGGNSNNNGGDSRR